jgi:hypothetical protein
LVMKAKVALVFISMGNTSQQNLTKVARFSFHMEKTQLYLKPYCFTMDSHNSVTLRGKLNLTHLMLGYTLIQKVF